MQIHMNGTTRVIDAVGVRYAHRRFGTPSAMPIVLLRHFTGGRDRWDRAMTDGLARDREVILVDNAESAV